MPSFSSHTKTTKNPFCPIIIEQEFSMIKHFRHAIEENIAPRSIGADPTGGMTRLFYSPEWLVETQQQFKKRMAESGLETRFDDVGNLYVRPLRHNFRSR